jgi:choline-sulfatase
MDRRRFLAGTSLLSLLATIEKSALAGVHGPATQVATGTTARKRPNVLLLMSDQHKRSCMGAYGDAVAKTPNLDALASQSVRFANAYCNNPVCAPSRASMMTGLYSHHLETQNNSMPFLPTHPTMAHDFNRAGYMTALIGKMHFVDAQTHGFQYKLDFNDWFQYLGPKVQIYADELARSNSGSGLPEIDDLWREEGDPWRGHRTLDNREGSVAVGRVSLLDEQDHFESFVARESVRFLHNFGNTDQPFFLISSFLKPHDPFMPAQRFAQMFDAEQMRLPESYGKADKSHLPKEVVKSIEFNAPTPELRDPMAARRRIAFYYANLAQMDDCVGSVAQAVADLNLENDTIICYTSDHGEMLGELGLWQKFQFYEGSCGVPLLIRVPGREAAACDAPVSLVSLSATLTELAGVQQIAPNDGKSIAAWIREPQRAAAHGPVFAEYGLSSREPKWMIREGHWKYTYWENDIPELYDLNSDPEELHNRAGEKEYAAKENELRQKLLAWHPPHEKVPSLRRHSEADNMGKVRG